MTTGWLRRNLDKSAVHTPSVVPEPTVDDRLPILIKEADAARDNKDWSNGERLYRKILSEQPELVGYWVQIGHCQKEQGNFVAAEISYRNAEALGVPHEDFLEHLKFACAAQGRSYSSVKEALTSTEVEAAAFLFLNRTNLSVYETRDYMLLGSREDLFDAMISSKAFAEANPGLLEVIAIETGR